MAREGRKLAPGGLLAGWPGRWPSGRLQGGKTRGQAHMVEDLDDDVVSENDGDYIPLSPAFFAHLRVTGPAADN